MPKTTPVAFRVTETERAVLNLAAEMAGMSVAAFVKARALAPVQGYVPPVPLSDIPSRYPVIPPTETTGYAPDLIDLNQPPCGPDADILEPAGPRTDLTPGQWKASATESRRRAGAIGKRPHVGPKAKTITKVTRTRAKIIDPRSVGPKVGECKHPIGRRIGDTCVVCGAKVAGKR